MRIAVFGSYGSLPSLEYAVSLAAITGILAGKQTLVVNFEDNGSFLSVSLNCVGDVSLGRLVEKFIAEHSFDSSDLRAQIISVVPPASWGEWPGRQFDLLPGPAALSPAYLDRIAAQRGQSIARTMIDIFINLDYELVVINLGRLVDTLCGEEFIKVADLFILRADALATVQNHISARCRYYPKKIETEMSVFFSEMIAFPDPNFITALTSRGFAESISRMSLDWAESENLFPTIGSQLMNCQGQRIKPFRNIFDRLFV